MMKQMNLTSKLRKNEGITLITLVVTIIVLLILARDKYKWNSRTRRNNTASERGDNANRK